MTLAILDVAIGLILVYIVLSLVASAITEAIAQSLGKRASVLRDGIRSLLGGEVANKFYAHRLMRSLSKQPEEGVVGPGEAGAPDAGDKRPSPSYIPSETFAAIVLDLVPADSVPELVRFVDARDEATKEEKKGGAAKKEDMAATDEAAKVAAAEAAKAAEAAAKARLLATEEAALGRTLLSFWRDADGDRARVLERIRQWFDDSMDRVTGWYRRWAQCWLYGVSIVVALALNANTIKIARVLYTNPALREMMVAEATAQTPPGQPGGQTTGQTATEQKVGQDAGQKAEQKPEPKPGQTPEPKPEEKPAHKPQQADQSKTAVEEAEKARRKADLDDLKNRLALIEPVLGWRAKDFPPCEDCKSWLILAFQTIAGCGVTVFAMSMGAGFWFKALSQLLLVRARLVGGAGKQPEAPSPGAAPAAAAAAASTPALPEEALVFKDSFDANADQHSHANGYWLGKAAELAYQDGTGFQNAVAAWGVECRHVNPPKNAGGIAPDTQAHVAANKDVLIVAFRGTETNIEDIATDVKFKKVAWKGQGNVHRGFHEALEAAWTETAAAIKALYKPTQTLWFTGHSLGGALAVLAAMRWTLENQTQPVRGVYTIGQPRVGDQGFCDAYRKALGPRTFRYINNRDTVPRIPMRSLGYADVGKVLYFDGKGRLHVDPGLWFRLLDIAFTDNSKLKDALKQAVGDHSASEYVERLRRAVPGGA